MEPTTDQHIIFAQGDKAPAEYFTGTVWLKVLSPNEESMHCQVANVTFEAGARTAWHKHPGGQVLLVTDGIGRYREKGKPVRIIQKGDVVTIAPGVEHWHGAAPDTAVTHIAVNPNSENGVVNWLEPVTEEEYTKL